MLVPVLGLGLALLAIPACTMWGDGHHGDGGSADTTLAGDYLDKVGGLEDGLGAHTAFDGDWADVETYHDRMMGMLDEMASIRGHMLNQCGALDGCEAGGGATGHVDGHCMTGGNTMGADFMDQLGQTEQACRDELDRHRQQCEQEAPADGRCTSDMSEHEQRMGQILGDMTDYCDQMGAGDVSGQMGDCGDHMM
jgi:hypothetical protein